MNKITAFLDHASTQYYVGTPVISDLHFDQLAQSVNYNKVGASLPGAKVRHMYPMFSLQKHYQDEGVSPLQEYPSLSSSPKLDGAAVSHLYVDTYYVRSVTRGDGVEGTDITDKFADSKLIPMRIPVPGVVQITGEVCAPKHIENARNYAAGALNLKSVAEFKTRAVEFFAYAVFPYLTSTYNEDMGQLSGFGFGTIKDSEIYNIYPCDGIVFRVNSNELFDSLGFTSKHPRGAYALKERQQAVETQILGVEWQVGKSGKVTPVAVLAPVMIGDAEVSRATLNNVGFIETLGIEIGDTVAVVRAGMIIPQILHKVEA